MIPNRIVLDTNVCLDLFVFRDPRWQALLDALRNGRVEAVTRADCRNEWLIVLRYEHLRLDDAGRQRATAEFDAVILCVDLPTKTSIATVAGGSQDAPDAQDDMSMTTVAAHRSQPAPLPVCRDPDDQKFLELARDAEAQTLITKDKLLLKLARKTARAGLFEILTPQAWTANHVATATTPPNVAPVA